MKLQRLNNALHRDIGYFFFGMAIIYGLSGIALNHRHHWNPNYVVSINSYNVNLPDALANEKETAMFILEEIDPTFNYKTHVKNGSILRIFIDGGSVNADLEQGTVMVEMIRKRPVFNQVNFLHYNTPRKLWTWFSDAFALGLIILAITGLFVLKGKNGLRRRGVYFVVTGIIIPLLLLYLYLSV